ncbi:hypothetical protein [Chelatococcus albus]|nr:hypothetical protein [Chelatococcus sp. SYSU_G07232]
MPLLIQMDIIGRLQQHRKNPGIARCMLFLVHVVLGEVVRSMGDETAVTAGRDHRRDIGTEASNPRDRFDHPAEVVAATDLSLEEKQRILEIWEQDARDLQVASEEGMAGGLPNLLDAVRQAMRDLGVASRDPDAQAPTKAGG